VDDSELLVFVETFFQFRCGRLNVELELLSTKHPVYLNRQTTINNSLNDMQHARANVVAFLRKIYNFTKINKKV